MTDIFLSYGHDEYAKLAERLKSDLEKAGYTIWIDKNNIPGSTDWQEEIEKGITNSEWMIIIMTNFSVRRPHGFCLDEVSLARGLEKKILPIMAEAVTPPLCITRIQWLDMVNYYDSDRDEIIEEKYQARLADILNVIKGISSLNTEGIHQDLLQALSPLDNDVYLESYQSDFYGREWLFERYGSWVKDRNSSKLFIILGKAGIGKTAFATNLARKHPEVVGIHFCKYNDTERANPKKALMSLAYHLSTQLPAYAEELVKLGDFDRLEEKDVHRLFECIFVEPLSKIPAPSESKVFIIDALDESLNNGTYELLDVIAADFLKTPKWLKLLVTSRAETEIKQKLVKYSPVVIEDDMNNNDDIQEYIHTYCTSNNIPITPEQETKFVARCEGSFLYAKEVLQNISDGILDVNDVDSFPVGLTGVYTYYFERLFLGDIGHYKEYVRPVLELLVASYEPLTPENVVEVLLSEMDWDEYLIEDVLDKLCTMFPVKNNQILPIHKSIRDWLIEREKSGKFHVSLKKGHKRLAGYYLNLINKKRLNKPAVKYLLEHLIDGGVYDENPSDYEQALTLLGQRVEELGTPDEKQDLLFSLLRVGDIMEARGKCSEALHYLIDALEVDEKCAIKHRTINYILGNKYTCLCRIADVLKLCENDETTSILHQHLIEIFNILTNTKNLSESESNRIFEYLIGSEIESRIHNSDDLCTILILLREYDDAVMVCNYVENQCEKYRSNSGRWNTIRNLPPRSLIWALLKMGDILMIEKEYSAALEKYQVAVKYLHELDMEIDAPPTNIQHSDGLCKLGDVLVVMGEYEEALRNYRRADTFDYCGSEIFIQIRSFNRLIKIANTYQIQKKDEDARLHYERALAICDKIVDDLEKPGEKRDMSESLESAGDVLQTQGRHAEALKYYQRALSLRETLMNEEKTKRASAEYQEALKKVTETQEKLEIGN